MKLDIKLIMNLNFYKTSIFLAIVFLLTTACEKETEYRVPQGDLIGYIYPVSDNTDKITEVIIEGSKPELRTLSDTNGKYIISGLKSGTYNILFKKEGFCEHKIVSFPFVGGSMPSTSYYTNLYKIPDIELDSLKISETGFTPYTGSLDLSVRITQGSNFEEDEYLYLRYFLSDKPDVSFTNYISTSTFYCKNESYVQSENIRYDTLNFPVNSEVFMIMYPASDAYQYYTDVNTGEKIYTSISIEDASNVVSYVVPKVLD